MKRILIVDDEPHVIRVMRLSLERAGYEVFEAANGEIALQRIAESMPDVMITDIDMPRMTGEQLCKEIQPLDAGADIPDLCADRACGAGAPARGRRHCPTWISWKNPSVSASCLRDWKHYFSGRC